ncbi:MAG: 2-hydroxyacyl-CoA dehydratase, partial [Desulfobacterales bacterium]|nr:2-hydroxyacyl-CoA dehydratase [Desulfobacterales bacterium]
RYLKRPTCAAKDFPERRRIPFILNLVGEYEVEGAIILLQNCCEPYSYDIPFLQEALKEKSIQSLVLETDASPDMGRIRNRVEAFLEVIRSQKGEL